MNGYAYHGGYSTHGLGQDDGSGQCDIMMSQDVVGGQSLDDIVNQSAKIVRRQSMPAQQQQQQSYGAPPTPVDADMRRISMMDFNGAPQSFTFDTSVMDQGGLTPAASHMQQPQQARQSLLQQRSNMQRPQQSGGEQLALNTNFDNTNQGFNALSAYIASPAHSRSGMEMNMANSYLDHTLDMGMNYNVDQGMGTHITGDGGMNLNMFNQAQYSNAMMSSPLQQTTQHGLSAKSSMPRGQSQDSAGPSSSGGPPGSTLRGLSRSQSMHSPLDKSPALNNTPITQQPSGPSVADSLQQVVHSSAQGLLAKSTQASSQSDLASNFTGYAQQTQHHQLFQAQDAGMHQAQSSSQVYNGINGPVPIDPATHNPNNQNFDWNDPEGGWPSTLAGRTHTESIYKNAYSSTGFNMLGVLMRVATRPNPEINLGSVDLSCAFVVCDAEKDDTPIVYCSDNFERLTGYTKHMILGRNCRFLQSPDGNVSPGVRRKYVDDDSVLYLKNMTNLQREAQISLINYRRGGQPFMNLLTMIPITWDSEQVKYFVGFQVDLVEQPNAVTNKNPDGSYSINYQRGITMPRYVMAAPESTNKADLGQTVPRDDVSAILTTIGSGESEYAKRMWDKVLLENTDDVVHVLSLKGLFQWVSPSAMRVLEYEPSELIGTALSSVCHPSDIVPVTRELKDTSSGASVNVVFRIRRKNSGYMWFEGHGSLHTEQGKGRKSIIMVGRERPVYTLGKADLNCAGGIGENELWTKLSTSGMFLFVSSNVRQLLDRQPEELVGVSIQSLMRWESKTEFGRILEHARTGKKASVKHEMINRRGQVLSAYTTLYPGDATEGQKPTFVLAQTRLIKFSRGAQASRTSIYNKGDRVSDGSVTPNQQLNVHPPSASGETLSSNVPARYPTTKGAAATYAGQHGLEIGHQDQSLASEDNLFDELKTTKSSSWQYEIRQLEKKNRLLAEEVQSLIAAKKKRKRRKGAGNLQKDCANCHTKVTPEWRRGPSGQRDLCNSCGLRWAKLNGRVSPRTNSAHSGGGASDKASKASVSPRNNSATQQSSALRNEPPIAASPSQGQQHNPSPPDGQLGKTMRGGSGDHSASMEGASGVPDMIREDIEPD